MLLWYVEYIRTNSNFGETGDIEGLLVIASQCDVNDTPRYHHYAQEIADMNGM